MAYPTTVTEVPSFLGFAGYYHQFIPMFLQVSKPLCGLTSNENAGKKKVAIAWHDRYKQLFDDLKHLCTTTPILAYADFKRAFNLHTDACGSVLGTVLYQTCDDGTDTIIAYASRCLTNAETHYLSYKLEFLALKWAMVEEFHIAWLPALPTTISKCTIGQGRLTLMQMSG